MESVFVFIFKCLWGFVCVMFIVGAVFLFVVFIVMAFRCLAGKGNAGRFRLPWL